MTVTLTQQLAVLAGAVLLGGALGLVYDVLRAMRALFPARAAGVVLDLLFWTAATAALFLWSLSAGDGQVQISTCVFLFLGAVLYFRSCSPWLLPLLRRGMHLLRRLWRLLTAPVRFLGRLAVRGVKNFLIFFKKAFSFVRR